MQCLGLGRKSYRGHNCAAFIVLGYSNVGCKRLPSGLSMCLRVVWVILSMCFWGVFVCVCVCVFVMGFRYPIFYNEGLYFAIHR